VTKRRPGRLPRWQEWSVYLTFALLIVTGVAWLLLDRFVHVAGEFGSEHHPAEHWAMIAHGTVAYAFLIVGGAMIPVHITLGWNTKRNLKTGLMLAGTCIILAVSALGLYYLADEISRSWVSLIHWSVGLIAAPALLIHALRGRRGQSLGS
jgi:hypothetical protein